MAARLTDEQIAARVAREFRDGDYINLGVGIPNLCASFVPAGVEVFPHAEHGVLGYGPLIPEAEWAEADFDYVDAGLKFFRPRPGMAFFDMGESFDMIRGRHLDATVLGAVQVSGEGDLANWTFGVPESGGIGGSMDLAIGARRVIVAMEHVSKKGEPKIVHRCRFPLTAPRCVHLICTDIAVIEVSDARLVLREVAPGWTPEAVQALTEPRLETAADLCEIAV
ncbi:MAG TPA: 3-oxoacid CoA-transferase subunit B [Rhodocyclaceae bacterium]|nr:3-oxoacid CoA-transferase subunit B [Rhodocyclaceae bacterium]